jgi:hypothetical protein
MRKFKKLLHREKMENEVQDELNYANFFLFVFKEVLKENEV